MSVPKLEDRPIHLGRGATAISQPPFTGMEWYAAYGARHGNDGAEGRLVSMHRFTGSWDSWEMHPAGDEAVICLEGEMLILQEHGDGTTDEVRLRAGEYAVNLPGTWHTADIVGEAVALFITAGLDTQHRPR